MPKITHRLMVEAPAACHTIPMARKPLAAARLPCRAAGSHRLPPPLAAPIAGFPSMTAGRVAPEHGAADALAYRHADGGVPIRTGHIRENHDLRGMVRKSYIDRLAGRNS